MSFFLAPQRLSEQHQPLLNGFSCREESLNLWLRQRALHNQMCGASRTFLVLTQTNLLAGFFSLASGSILHGSLKALYRRNMPDPVPVILLGRLAVDCRFEGMGVGKSMLHTATNFASQVTQTIGVTAIVTDPISESASSFYQRFGFRLANKDGKLLILPLKNW